MAGSLKPEDAQALYRLFGDGEQEEEARLCRFRGCQEIGMYYMRRQLRGDAVQEGIYCEKHEQQFGEENLRRAARESGGRVHTLVDSAGKYRGIKPKEGKKNVGNG